MAAEEKSGPLRISETLIGSKLHLSKVCDGMSGDVALHFTTKFRRVFAKQISSPK
jgi:hypothetical protein